MYWHFTFLWIILTAFLVSANKTCQTWHYYNKANGKCECGYLLKCSSEQNKVEIDNTYCATPLGQEGDYYIRKSLIWYISKNGSTHYSEMPGNTSQLEEVMCSPHNRRGFMCGECIDGFGPAVFSVTMDCKNCTGAFSRHYAIPVYLLVQFIPTTLLFVFLVIFRFNITSGPLLGYILFCQVNTLWIIQYRMFSVNMSTHLHVSKSTKLLTHISQALFLLWTLSFSEPVIPPFCISQKLSKINIEVFQLVIATYPLVLITAAYILLELHTRQCKIVRILCKPFEKILKKVNITLLVTSDAIFHALASLFFLSNLTVTIGMFKLVVSSAIYNSTGAVQEHVLLIDPTVKVLNRKHIVCLLIATVPFLLASLLPSLLLLIYPTRLYRYLSRFLSARKQLAITAFAEAIHSCFKDGLNGTTDYRALAAMNLFAFIPYDKTSQYLSTILGCPDFLITLFMWVMSACIVSYLKPFKEKIANICNLSPHFVHHSCSSLLSLG